MLLGPPSRIKVGRPGEWVRVMDRVREWLWKKKRKKKRRRMKGKGKGKGVRVRVRII